MKSLFWNILAVGSAGFVGSILRWGVGRWLNTGALVPWGTLLVNLVGSFILGWFMTLTSQRVQVSETTQLAVAVGFIGALTTFSSLMYETDGKLQDRSYWLGAGYLVGSIVLGLVALRAGVILARAR